MVAGSCSKTALRTHCNRAAGMMSAPFHHCNRWACAVASQPMMWRALTVLAALPLVEHRLEAAPAQPVCLGRVG
eukprot:830957-Rhodomonas_salina.1